MQRNNGKKFQAGEWRELNGKWVCVYFGEFPICIQEP